MKGKVRASVSTDAIKSTYNHLRHRLMRPVAEGGRELADVEAEQLVREHIRKTFYSAGAWRVISLDGATFGKIMSAEGEKLSLEDALEFGAYQLARARTAGPTMFVTRDSHFPEGVHPHHVARQFALL